MIKSEQTESQDLKERQRHNSPAAISPGQEPIAVFRGVTRKKATGSSLPRTLKNKKPPGLMAGGLKEKFSLN